MDKTYHFIYKTTNLLNGKFYVGMHSTDNLNDGYFGSGKIINLSVAKHGIKNHLVEIVEMADSREALRLREEEIVNSELLQNPLCMNLRYGGGSHGGHSESSRKLLSEAGKKRIGELNSFYGKTHSDEFREKISARHKGAKHSEQHKKKIGAAQTGEKHCRFGKPLSDEYKQKISASLKGKKPGNCRAIIINEIEYQDLVTASKEVGISIPTIRNRARSSDPKFAEFYYKDEPKNV